MNSPNPVPTAAPAVLPWYKSPQQISNVTAAASALIAIFPKLGQWLGITSPSDIATDVTNIFAAIAVIAPFVGTILRARSKLQPLTLTQGRADSHPAALAATRAAMQASAQGGAQK